MYVDRECLESFQLAAKTHPLVALVGPRQAGKTTFLKEQVKELDRYVSFDDPDVRQLFDQDVKQFEKQYLDPARPAVLDEIQNAKDTGNKLKYLADKGYRLWISSSSQTILEKDVLGHLVGRVGIVPLYPFSYPEFKRAKRHVQTTASIERRLVWEHAVYGGYPRAALAETAEEKKTILTNLYQTLLFKDVASTFAIENTQTLDRFTRYLAHSPGHLLSYEKLSAQFGLAFLTAKKYLDALEKSYVIFRVPPFYTNKLKEITKQPKTYFWDTGLCNALRQNYPAQLQDEGRLFENYAACELTKLGFTLKHWHSKGGAEVDFIIEKEGTLVPIEVKVRDTPGKVERSLRSFIETYRPKKALLVHYQPKDGGLDDRPDNVRKNPTGQPLQNAEQTRVDDCTVLHVPIQHLATALAE